MPSEKKPTILLATGNAGKVREFAGMFSSLPIDLRSLLDFPEIQEVEETGATFRENAALKAAGYARQTGLCSLADDSGLEINALGGAPGVLSARYGGPEAATFADKIELVLNQLRSVGDDRWTARFVCSIVLTDEVGRILTEAMGECPGRIAPAPRGTRGFGYDPIFVPEGFEETFGELEDAVKAQISHRARASAKIIRYLLDFTGVST